MKYETVRICCGHFVDAGCPLCRMQELEEELEELREHIISAIDSEDSTDYMLDTIELAKTLKEKE